MNRVIGTSKYRVSASFCICTTLRYLFDERSILSNQGGIFLKNELSEQAELSEQGEYFFNNFVQIHSKFEK